MAALKLLSQLETDLKFYASILIYQYLVIKNQKQNQKNNIRQLSPSSTKRKNFKGLILESSSKVFEKNIPKIKFEEISKEKNC